MRAVTACPITGGRSPKMQRTVPSVKPWFRRRQSNVSTAFDTMHVSRPRYTSTNSGTSWAMNTPHRSTTTGALAIDYDGSGERLERRAGRGAETAGVEDGGERHR